MIENRAKCFIISPEPAPHEVTPASSPSQQTCNHLCLNTDDRLFLIHVGVAGGTQARGNRHDRAGSAAVEGKGGSPLRIVIAGDFHLRPNGGDQARRYMEKIMEAQPDMIFLLGDYANGHTRESSMSPETAREYFKMLKAPLGIFAVQGNHDQYYGWDLWRNMFSELGILPMWNDSLLLHLPGGRDLQLSSVRDDYHLRIRPEELPLRFSPDIPHILLSHVPDIFPLLAPGTADAVISAHTHGGQICLPGGKPLANISREKAKFSYPWSQLNGTPFLITRGLGCSVLPLRFCCPPEIIVLEIQ